MLCLPRFSSSSPAAAAAAALSLGSALLTRRQRRSVFSSDGPTALDASAHAHLDPRPASVVSAWPPFQQNQNQQKHLSSSNNSSSQSAVVTVAPGMLVYRFPLNVFASGAHRVAGVALVAGFSGVVCGAAAAFPRGGRGGFARAVEVLGRAPLRPLLWGVRWCVSFPLVYHWLAGIRFLAWECGAHSYDFAACTRSSAAIFAAAAAASTALVFGRFPLPPSAVVAASSAAADAL